MKISSESDRCESPKVPIFRQLEFGYFRYPYGLLYHNGLD
jgi:hypothetical protein